MHMDIAFPNIGIHLSHVGKSISIFGFEIAFYGMIIGMAILLGIFIAVREARRTRQNPDIYFDLAIYGVIVSVICARLYYVIFSWDMYKGNLLSILNLRQGGLAIYGGIIGAVLTGVVVLQDQTPACTADFRYRGNQHCKWTDAGTLGQLFQPGGVRRIYQRTSGNETAGGCGSCSGHYGTRCGNI